MPKPRAVCLSLAIALLAVPGDALAANVVTPSSVAESTTVPAGGSRTLTLRCPTTAVALNAAVTEQGGGITVRRSSPGAGPGDWRFRLSAAAGSRQRRVRAVLRCVRLTLPQSVSGARLTVETQRSPALNVPGGSAAALQVRCGAGYVATGYGLNRGARRDVTIAAAQPSASGWDFNLENTGAASASASVRVRCLKRAVNAREGGQLRFEVARRVFSDSVGPMPGSSGTFTHTCARSQFSVATGHVVDQPSGIVVPVTAPAGRRVGGWTFRGAGDDDVVTSFLLCLSRRTQFR
jgi:hypothetical protein